MIQYDTIWLQYNTEDIFNCTISWEPNVRYLGFGSPRQRISLLYTRTKVFSMGLYVRERAPRLDASSANVLREYWWPYISMWVSKIILWNVCPNREAWALAKNLSLVMSNLLEIQSQRIHLDTLLVVLGFASFNSSHLFSKFDMGP